MDDGLNHEGGSCVAPSPAELLGAAIARHRAGRHIDAEALYEAVLAEEPDNVGALHLLGVLRHQAGDAERAEPLVRKAAEQRPDVGVIQASLAEVLLALGRNADAAETARTAVRCEPNDPTIRFTLGLALQGMGQAAEAVDAFQQAVALNPEFAAAQHNLGNLLRLLGRLEDAERHLRTALALVPDQPLSHTSLATALVALGRPAEALPHCEEALRLRPNEATFVNNYANVLRLLRRFDDARDSYLRAIELDPKLAIAHASLGLVFLELDRIDEAICLMARAVELEPSSASHWEYLAELHGRVEHFEEAIQCWERVMALAPDNRAQPHRSFGWALQETNRGDEAEGHYLRAAALAPQWAMPQLDLGILYEERGRFADAATAYRAAIQLDARCALAHSRLALLLAGELPDTDLDAIVSLLDDPTLDPGPRTRLLFAMAQIADGQGNYRQAAECLEEANALQLALYPRYNRFQPSEHERFIDDLIRSFDRDFFARTAGAGLESTRPVFVVGLPRSGTTLVEQILASHPLVHGAGELSIGRRIFESLPAILNRPAAATAFVPALDGKVARELALHYEAELLRLAGGSPERVVDKTPDNAMYLGLLLALFPRATVIYCRRDVRDVALSCWMADFRSVFWANHPDHIGSKFRGHARLMAHWQDVLPATIHEVDYEATVADLETVARRLIAAIGLDWHPACLEFHRTKRPVRTSSVVQVRKPIYNRSVARWKRYEHELPALFNAVAAD